MKMNVNGNNHGQWSVFAEFTVSHPGVNAARNSHQTYKYETNSGIHMKCGWSPNANTNAKSANKFYQGSFNDLTAETTFQRGNLTFSSIPPQTNIPKKILKLGTCDSGYGSDLLSSPNSLSSILTRRTEEKNRRCRSTCNIVLKTNNVIHEDDGTQKPIIYCSRTKSLRCQTPNSPCSRQNTYYGCGDPWCYHTKIKEKCNFNISPVVEEVTHGSFISKYPRISKDVSVQTFEMVDKCTSPLENHIEIVRNKTFAKNPIKNQLKTKLRQKTFCPPLATISRCKHNNQHSSLSLPEKMDRDSDKAVADGQCEISKKLKTVHIDVYCTDTDIESSSSLDSSENQSESTTQTVFSSKKHKVTHKRASKNITPFNINSSCNTTIELDDSESDYESSSYPSRLSSYSTLKDLSSSISSIGQPCTTSSMSSFVAPTEFDIVGHPPFKHICADVDNLLKKEDFRSDCTNARCDKLILEQPTIKSNVVFKDVDKEVIKPTSKDYELSMNNIISLDSTVKTHNNVVTGSYNQRFTAKKFGEVMKVLRKPGHHIGPTKNPNCLCDHCQIYFNRFHKEKGN